MAIGDAPLKKPAPPVKEWQPIPGKPGLERNRAGQMRTSLPTPPSKMEEHDEWDNWLGAC